MSETPQSQIAVRRFTTEYLAPEDRLRISLERMDDSLAILWLTRRLAIRLVPQILKVVKTLPRLQGQPQAAAPATDNAQRANQMAALGKLEQQSPVLGGDLPEGIESHLITGLGVRMARGALLLDFKVGEEVMQILPFSEEALRQWLGVLHVSFVKAGWQEDIWPDWITAKGWDQGPDALRLN